MSGHITWGVCRASDGSPLRTVFCMHCREVFGRNLDAVGAVETKERAIKSHKCLKLLSDAIERVARENDKKTPKQTRHELSKSGFVEV